MPTLHQMHPKVENVFLGMEGDFETFTSLLKQLSLTDTLIFCFRVNHILSEWKKSHADKQKEILGLFFTQEEVQRIFSGSPRISSYDQLSITTRGPMMVLMQWASMFCEDHDGDGTTFKDPGVRQIFAKVMLIADDLWQKKIGMERMLEDVPVDEARYNLLSTFRQNAAGTHQPTQHGTISVAKGYAMFVDPGYFPERHGEFAEQFQAVSGMSIEDYYICLTYIASNVLDGKTDGKSAVYKQQALDSVPADFRDTFDKFISLETQDAAAIRHALWGDIQQSSVKSFDDASPVISSDRCGYYFCHSSSGKNLMCAVLIAGRGAVLMNLEFPHVLV